MSAEVLVAVIAAAASIVAAVISAWRSASAEQAVRESTERTAHLERQNQVDLERMRAEFAAALERTRRELDADELVAQYREPLAGAAFDLRLRLRNITAGNFLQAYASRRANDVKRRSSQPSSGSHNSSVGGKP